jgi:hypothetical protein
MIGYRGFQTDESAGKSLFIEKSDFGRNPSKSGGILAGKNMIYLEPRRLLMKGGVP